jgi:hypothetical protein
LANDVCFAAGMNRFQLHDGAWAQPVGLCTYLVLNTHRPRKGGNT